MPIEPFLRDDIILRLPLKAAIKLRDDHLQLFPEYIERGGLEYENHTLIVAPSDYELRHLFADKYTEAYRDINDDVLIANQFKTNEFTVLMYFYNEELNTHGFLTITQAADECGISIDLDKYLHS